MASDRAPGPVRVPPPGPAIAAAVLGVLSAVVPGFLVLILLALDEDEDFPANLPWILVLAALAVALVVGALLLLLGRSWLALVVPAGAVAALVVVARVAGGAEGRLFGLLAIGVPLATAGLAALPGVRSWVRARRSALPPASQVAPSEQS